MVPELEDLPATFWRYVRAGYFDNSIEAWRAFVAGYRSIDLDFVLRLQRKRWPKRRRQDRD
jgi:hypothetical protein